MVGGGGEDAGGRKSGEFGTVLSIAVSRICQCIGMCH